MSSSAEFASVMIALIGKWMYAQEDDLNSSQECFIVEAEEGEWLLIDLQLTEEDALLLKDYVVVDERHFGRGHGGEKSLPIKGANETNVEKSPKCFHGKMISRLLPRKTVQPYKILRPLKSKTFEGEVWNVERLQQMNSWLEMLSTRVPRPLGTMGNIPALRVNAKR